MSLAKSILSPFNSSLGFRKMSNAEMQEAIRFENYRLFYRFYSGNHRSHERTDDEDHITVNMCEAFVDKNAAFLAGKGFTITDEDGKYDNDAVEYVREAWKRSNKDVVFYESAHNASLFGDFAYVILEDENGQPKVYDYPCVYVWPYFHPDFPDLLTHARVEYLVDNTDGTTSVTTLIIDSQKVSKYKDGVLQDYKLHLLGEPPIVFGKNKHLIGSTLGKSDIHGLIDLQKSYNAKMTDMSDIISYHASPITLGYGVRIDALEKSASKMISGLPPDSRIENLEAKGDMSAAITHLRDMKRILHQMGATPEIAFGSVDELRFSNSSGLALQLLFQPMIDTLKIKHIYQGKALRDVARILIKYGIRRMELKAPKKPKDLVDFLRVGVVFPDPLPRDELLELNTIASKLDKRLILPSKALQQLGETNIPKYFKQLQEEWAMIMESGYQLGSQNANLGGNIAENNSSDILDREQESDDSEDENDSESEK